MSQPKIYLYHLPSETEYLYKLKPIVAGKAAVTCNHAPFVMGMEIALRAKAAGTNLIATTSSKLLEFLVQDTKKKPTLDKYAGSIIEKYDCKFLILDPLDHLFTVSYGKFLTERFFRKFLSPSSWMHVPEFSWELYEPKEDNRLRSLFSTATFISADIETLEEPRGTITSIGFSAVHINFESKCYTITTVVVPFTDLYNIAFARTILGLSVPKVFQNGKYDNAYLLRYNCITNNWCYDTAHMFHSWYSELPKDLGLLTAFFLRDWIYHKELGKDNSFPSMEYFRYNAMDSFSTAAVWLAMMMEAPDWAWKNYYMEFPLVFPALLCELTGMRINLVTQEALSDKLEGQYKARLEKIRIMVGNSNYNPGSWQQTQKVFELLGSSDIKNTDAIGMDKVMSRHPLNERIIGEIKGYKQDKKKDSAYTGKEFTWHGRCYYSLNPQATDTGRHASRESAFWCGLNIQNIPREPNNEKDANIKDMFEAEPGFLFGEADGAQNEARCTGYISGDKNLIDTVESDRDYHGINAERFFGIPYAEIIGPNGKTLKSGKEIRDLSKRTNHGANYNMGPGVLVDTMGVRKILRAKELLKLPSGYSLKQVAKHLLASYDKAYPIVRDLDGGWYARIIDKVLGQQMLVGATGWTRYCFGNPAKNKRDMNAYAAHESQSLAAMILNMAWKKVFYQIALPEPKDFRLLAQIHDSIFFQYRIGREDLAWKVKELMEIPVQVVDIFGIKRIMLIPVDLKGNGKRWSDTETLYKKVA